VCPLKNHNILVEAQCDCLIRPRHFMEEERTNCVRAVSSGRHHVNFISSHMKHQTQLYKLLRNQNLGMNTENIETKFSRKSIKFVRKLF
jgi:hypothetical protein